MIALLLAAAARPDVVGELIARSADLRSFTAVYSLTLSTQAAATEIRIDYSAPSKVRVDFRTGGELTSMWCVDGVQALSSTTVGGRADSRDVFQELAHVERTFAESFPDAPPRAPLAAGVGLTWSFDTKAQKANFSIEAQLREPAASALGWLSTLEQKSAVAKEDGSLLRFETDGHFVLALSKEGGVLQDFAGTSPKGEMHLALVSSELDAEIDPARFAIAAPPPGAKDASADLRRSIRRLAQSSLRRRIYRAIAAADAQAGDVQAPARIDSTWRAFHAHVVGELMASWTEQNRKLLDGVAQQLRKLRESGRSAAEVEEARQRERGFLAARLDELERDLGLRTTAPAECRQLPKAGEILEREQRILLETFRKSVREAALAAFDAGTEP